MSKNLTYKELEQRIKELEKSESNHKLYEAEIKASKDFYKNIIEGVQDGIWVTDKNDVIIYVNEGMSKIAGIRANDILGNNVLHDFQDETTIKFCEFYKKAKKELITVWYETEVKTPAGRDTSQNGWLIPRIKDDEYDGVICTIRDVTERIKAEKAILESEGKYRKVLETVSDAIYLLSEDGTIVDTNQTACDMLARSKDEIVDSTIDSIDYNFSKDEFIQLCKSIPFNEIYKFETSHLRKDGHLIPIKIIAKKYKLIEKVFYYFIARDITDSKKAEDLIEVGESRFRELVDTINSGVAIYKVINDGKSGSDYIIEDFNKYALSHEKLLKEDVIGKSLKDIRPTIDDYGLIDIFRKVWKSGKAEFFPAKIYIDDNYTNYYENRIFKLPDGEIVAVYDDVTENKISEKKLEKSKERFKKVIDSSLFPIAVIDENVDSIMYWSQSALTMFGHNPSTIGEWQELAYPDPVYRQEVIERWKPLMTKAEQNKTPLNLGEYNIVCKNGSLKICEIFVQFIPGSCILTIHDITESKQAEKEQERLHNQLRQAQKMESVGRLAGGVAHDYNNMSSIIIGYSELALEKVEQGDPLHDNLIEILKAANRSTDITRQLLTFARKQTVAPKVLDLKNAIGSMIKMIRRLIGEDIDLVWLPGEDVWSIKIDPSQIDQILANLCINARDAIANVGKITIETKNVIFDEDYCCGHAGVDPGEYVLLAVSDDGSGMTLEIQNKIFEPFFTTKDIGEGTGLGLSTVYGIVKQNNGFINVYSESEKGTTIRIYLPRYAGRSLKAHSEKTIETPLSRGEKVLLVEDDDSILNLCKMILENLGYTVLSATSPNEATRLASEHANEISLLITDVIMPEMNGRELSEQLQSQNLNLKTLFMSGYTADIISNRGVLEEGVSFIAKPFSIKELALKVREVLDEVID